MEGYYKHTIGKWGENEAVNFLQYKGFKIRACNFRTRYGELDIVAEKGQVLYFFEVKTRSDLSVGTFESFTYSKRQRFLAAAQLYRYIHKIPDTQACKCVLLVVIGTDSQSLTRFIQYDIV
jgi:putative endonuclease